MRWGKYFSFLCEQFKESLERKLQEVYNFSHFRIAVDNNRCVFIVSVCVLSLRLWCVPSIPFTEVDSDSWGKSRPECLWLFKGLWRHHRRVWFSMASLPCWTCLLLPFCTPNHNSPLQHRGLREEKVTHCTGHLQVLLLLWAWRKMENYCRKWVKFSGLEIVPIHQTDAQQLEVASRVCC